MLVTYCTVMHGPSAMCTLAPLPSIVLNEFIMSSSLSLITMSRANMIHRGSSWITAYLRVPGFGVTGSSSPSSVTTYTLPSLPPMACLPNPIAQSASRCRFFSQLGSQRQQSSIGLPFPQEKKPRFLLEALIFLCTSSTANSGSCTGEEEIKV
uniref:Putative pectate lyase 5 n=1 Tax=Rhizophora mucronata TaxID=61149 RepID=A0A2P2JLE0_RHIMU